MCLSKIPRVCLPIGAFGRLQPASMAATDSPWCANVLPIHVAGHDVLLLGSNRMSTAGPALTGGAQ